MIQINQNGFRNRKSIHDDLKLVCGDILEFEISREEALNIIGNDRTLAIKEVYKEDENNSVIDVWKWALVFHGGEYRLNIKCIKSTKKRRKGNYRIRRKNSYSRIS